MNPFPIVRASLFLYVVVSQSPERSEGQRSNHLASSWLHLLQLTPKPGKIKHCQMECIWAPWRMEYIVAAKGNGCILCQKPAEKDDETNLILYRSRNNFIILNSFPYNPGHLMVAPYRHLAYLEDLTDEELMEHFTIVKKSVELLTEVLKPMGFNIGLNIGKIAGAGIEEHIHTHIVPRWQGDTNFMPVLSGTKVVPEALKATYHRLKANLS